MWLKVFIPPEGLAWCPSLSSIPQLGKGLYLPSPHDKVRYILLLSFSRAKCNSSSPVFTVYACANWMYMRLSSSQHTQASPGLRACKLTHLLGGLISCWVSYFYCDSLWPTYSYLLERQKCKLISEAATEAAEDSHGDVVSASNYHNFSPPFGFPFQSSMSRAVDKMMETVEVFFFVHMPWHLCGSLL